MTWREILGSLTTITLGVVVTMQTLDAINIINLNGLSIRTLIEGWL